MLTAPWLEMMKCFIEILETEGKQENLEEIIMGL